MIAMKKTKSHVQALPGMAKDEAKVADVVHLLGTSRSGGPSPRAPLPPKSLDDDDKGRSGGSSLDDEFLSYLSGSGNIPPPVPPPPSAVAMVPASARTESNRASVEASMMMHATAGLGNALRRTMLVADIPADAAPTDRAGVPSQAQALLNTAKDEAKIADAVNAGTLRPSPQGNGLARSPSHDTVGGRTSDDPTPSTLSATLPLKSRCPSDPAPSALGTPHGQYADLPPLPSAPPLELLMEDGFFNGPMGDRPTTDVPPPGDEGHARMACLGEAAVVLMPVCEAVRTVDPTPAQDEEDNDALADWTVKCGKCMIGGIGHPHWSGCHVGEAR